MAPCSANRLLLFFVFLLFFSCKNDGKHEADRIYKKPTIVANPVLRKLSPAEALKSFYLPEGYKIELVASEPMIGEPVSISWDGDGRMYVAQMLTYMQDADATNETAPWSRVSLLEDTDGDGKMDKNSVFIDSLVLPRMVLPLDDRIIIGETFNRSLYTYRDTNGDGKADEKTLLLEDTARDNRNLEHQDANMLWSIDNWLYVTNKAFRYRFAGNRLLRDTLPEPMPGQWGLTEDETGRLFFSRAGAEIPALGFQQHPSYGSLELKGQWDESFLEPWPIVGTPDAQGGPRRLRPGENTLNRFTGVAGQEIYQGNKMPNAYGDLFIPEPVGRLVRRASVEHRNGKIVLANPYRQTEFLASTDPLFRPVFAATGPDGCLYVVDMYRGIIQEGTWVGEGSYLRGVVKERGYDKYVQRGRIYRIYREGQKPDPRPQLLHLPAKELLPLLAHPNGWWRMMAQKLLVVRGDKSVVPDLKKVVDDNEGFFAHLFHPNKDFGLERLHALWTLEGLEAVDFPLLKKALHDKDARVRSAAIRLSEPFLKQQNADVLAALKTVADDRDPEVIQQLLLTFRLRQHETRSTVELIAKRFGNNELIEATAKENLSPSFSQIQALSEQYKLKGGETATQIINGFRIFQDNCAACHGADGRGTPPLAPPLVGSPRLKGDPGMAIRILLHGLTGPVSGKTYNGPMASQAAYTDEELADVLSYVREHLNGSGTIWRGNIRRVREEWKDRKNYWTLEELKLDSAKKKT